MVNTLKTTSLLLLLLLGFSFAQCQVKNKVLDKDSVSFRDLQIATAFGAYTIPVTIKEKGKKITKHISRFKNAFWASIASGNHPPVAYKGSSFDIGPSTIHGVGLFTNSKSSFKKGKPIAYAYYKKDNKNKFSEDYIETPYGTFINNSDSANAELVIRDDGIVMVAKENISSGTEIVCSYKQLIALFPKDLSDELNKILVTEKHGRSSEKTYKPIQSRNCTE